jgi:O-succinylbenzoic acid--CoA ligase
VADRPLTAVLLPRPDAATAIADRWDRDEAVAVLDPDAPRAAVERVLDTLTPTQVLDSDGVHQRRDGVPVASDIAAVVVTSGTTDEPKCVELTTAGAEAIGHGFAHALGAEPDDRALVCVPLHHVAGLAILARARVTGTPVDVHHAFDVAAVGAAPAATGTTIVSLVPTMLARLLAAGAPLDAYRVLVLGGAPLSDALRERARSAGANVVVAYGLSETWGGVVVDGAAIDGADVVLATDANDDAVAREILVRGPMVMARYRGDPGATDAAFTSAGWFRTGDLGEELPGRGLRVVDRLKDLVVSGGVNVSPTAVEAVLADAPGVRDVCITGAPDDEWGERVVAFIVADDPGAPPTLDDLRGFAGDQLSRPQLPKQVVVVDAIPRTAGGKVLRRSLQVPAR